MSFWTTSLAGVLVGGGITTATQVAMSLATSRRDARREARAGLAKADAAWKALQLQTLVDIQENLEQGASNLSTILVEAAMSGRWHRPKFPDMIPFTRALMLCSRLEDVELGRDLRAWIIDNRNLMTTQNPVNEDWTPIRDRRIALQDRLGAAIRQLHGR